MISRGLLKPDYPSTTTFQFSHTDFSSDWEM